MDNMLSKFRYDDVIIGAGVSGLAIGIYLQKKGHKVLICEKHYQVGGYVHSFTRKGKYKFDSAVRIIAGARKGLLNALLASLDVDLSQKFIKIDNVYQVTFPTGSYKSTATRQGFLNELISSFPEEANGIRSLVREMQRIYNEVLDIQQNKGKSVLESAVFKKYSTMSFSDLMSKYIVSAELKSTISALWAYFGTPPEEASSLYYSYAILSFFNEGAYYVKGSFSSLSNDLAKKFNLKYS